MNMMMRVTNLRKTRKSTREKKRQKPREAAIAVVMIMLACPEIILFFVIIQKMSNKM